MKTKIGIQPKTHFERLIVDVTPDEAVIISELSEQERRGIRIQGGILIREALTRRGLLPTAHEVK
jgi:hypothetical protein